LKSRYAFSAFFRIGGPIERQNEFHGCFLFAVLRFLLSIRSLRLKMCGTSSFIAGDWEGFPFAPR
jgi:hypothetical protein